PPGGREEGTAGGRVHGQMCRCEGCEQEPEKSLVTPIIGLSVNRDSAKCGLFDLHDLILVPDLSARPCLRRACSDAISAGRQSLPAFSSQRSRRGLELIV